MSAENMSETYLTDSNPADKCSCTEKCSCTVVNDVSKVQESN